MAKNYKLLNHNPITYYNDSLNTVRKYQQDRASNKALKIKDLSMVFRCLFLFNFINNYLKKRQEYSLQKVLFVCFLHFIATLAELFWGHARQTLEVFREERRVGETEFFRNLDDGLIAMV